MKKLVLAAAFAASLPVVAFAQAAAPDGSKPFGIEPYVGVLGGYESFDKTSEFGTIGGRGKMNGGLVDAIGGVNLPLGPVFVGVEGNVGKGFNDVQWEYGAKARAGLRAGDSGLIYVSGGYQWVNGRHGFADHSDWMWGGGVEVGPKDIGLGGITGSAGPRLRLQVDTYDFNSIRPMAGVVFHF